MQKMYYPWFVFPSTEGRKKSEYEFSLKLKILQRNIFILLAQAFLWVKISNLRHLIECQRDKRFKSIPGSKSWAPGFEIWEESSFKKNKK